LKAPKTNNNIQIDKLREYIKRIIRNGEDINDEFRIQDYKELFVKSKNKSTQNLYICILNKYFRYNKISEINVNDIKKSILHLNNTSRRNVIRIILTLLNWITKNNYYDFSSTIKEIKSSTKEFMKKKVINNLIALNENDLEILFNYETSNIIHKQTIDKFLIQCYIGQRYSDLCKIKKNMIFLYDKPENNIYGHIELTSRKTRTYTKIPIHKRLYMLLERNKYEIRIQSLFAYIRTLRNALKTVFSENVTNGRLLLSLSTIFEKW
jgi:hypothetical protein